MFTVLKPCHLKRQCPFNIQSIFQWGKLEKVAPSLRSKVPHFPFYIDGVSFFKVPAPVRIISIVFWQSTLPLLLFLLVKPFQAFCIKKVKVKLQSIRSILCSRRNFDSKIWQIFISPLFRNNIENTMHVDNGDTAPQYLPNTRKCYIQSLTNFYVSF